MSSKFNKYIFYIDSTRQTVNFDSLDEVNEYVCDGEFIQATMWILLQTLKEINENGGVIVEPEEVS